MNKHSKRLAAENLVACYKLTFAVCGKRDYESLDHPAGYTGKLP